MNKMRHARSDKITKGYNSHKPLPSYLGDFDGNHIISQNLEMYGDLFLQNP